jgi:hypothetical protein
LAASPAGAKWWIFGQAAGPVRLNYAFINQIPLDETGTKVTLYRELLKDGLVKITGRATVRQGTVASVRVSLDDKESWRDAKLSENGAFEYSFTPEKGQAIVFYLEAMDSSGKTNEVDLTRREITVSDERIQARVRETLEAMAQAYTRENIADFMANVADDFAGDATLLDRAVRNDFTQLENIDLRFTLNNVAGGNGDRVYVSLTFNRAVQLTRSGQRKTDRGVTEFTFRTAGDRLKVFSMKNPLLFGVSDPDVATGNTTSGENTENLTLGTTVTESLTLSSSGDTDSEGYIFATKTVTTENDPPNNNALSGDIAMDPQYGTTPFLIMRTGGYVQDLGPGSLDSFPQAPTFGYVDNHHSVYAGNVYALKLHTGRYVLLEVMSIGGSQSLWSLSLRYKYQPDGTPNF